MHRQGAPGHQQECVMQTVLGSLPRQRPWAEAWGSELSWWVWITAMTLTLSPAVSGPQSTCCQGIEPFSGKTGAGQALMLKSLSLFETQCPPPLGQASVLTSRLPRKGKWEDIWGQTRAQALTIPRALFFLPGMVSSLDNDAESRRMTQGSCPVSFELNRDQPWSEAGPGANIVGPGAGLSCSILGLLAFSSFVCQAQWQPRGCLPSSESVSSAAPSPQSLREGNRGSAPERRRVGPVETQTCPSAFADSRRWFPE